MPIVSNSAIEIISRLFSDLWLVCRSLLRRPLFFWQCVITLGIGLGCVTALLYLLDVNIERHLAIPADVYVVAAKSPNGALITAQWESQLIAFKDRTDVLSEVAASSYTSASVFSNGHIVADGIIDVTPGLLRLLGAKIKVGRGWEGQPASENQGLLISETLCRKLFGHSENALGERLSIDNVPSSIVGVIARTDRLPKFFRGDVYRLLNRHAVENRPWELPLTIVGKLRPGMSTLRAADQLQRTPVAVPETLQSILRSNSIFLFPVSKLDDFKHPEVLLLLAAAVALLYLCATFSAAGLIIVRTIERATELSVRYALGATSANVYRIFLLEGFILMIGGILLGLGIAFFVIPFFAVAAGAGLNIQMDGSLAGLVSVMLLALAAITATIVAFIPLGLTSKLYWNGLAVRSGGIGLPKKWLRMRSALVIAQTAIAVVLLGTAGLVFTTVDRLMNVEFGFKTAQRLQATIVFAGAEISDDILNARLRDLEYHLRKVPGIRSVSLASDPLLAGRDLASLTIDLPNGDPAITAITYTWGDYVSSAGVDLKAGRWASVGSNSEVVVNTVFAARQWPGKNPIGEFVKPHGAPSTWPGWHVVGLTDSVRNDLHLEPTPRIFLPASSSPRTINTVFILVDGSLKKTRSLIEQAMNDNSASARLLAITPLSELPAAQLGQERNAMHVLNSLALFAVILVCVGMFTLLAQLVQVRSKEFGVRLALGASPVEIVQIVVKQAFALALLGAFIGLIVIFSFVKVLTHIVLNVPGHDLRSLVATVAFVIVALLVAAIGPSFRASRLDPAKLLRAL